MSNSTNYQNNESYTSIGEWAVRQFGFAEARSCYLKLGEEFGELARPLQKREYDKAAHEMADMIIVLSHMAISLGVDLDKAVREKMTVNRVREWKITPEGTGTHVDMTERPATKEEQVYENQSDTLP